MKILAGCNRLIVNGLENRRLRTASHGLFQLSYGPIY